MFPPCEILWYISHHTRHTEGFLQHFHLGKYLEFNLSLSADSIFLTIHNADSTNNASHAMAQNSPYTHRIISSFERKNHNYVDLLTTLASLQASTLMCKSNSSFSLVSKVYLCTRVNCLWKKKFELVPIFTWNFFWWVVNRVTVKKFKWAITIYFDKIILHVYSNKVKFTIFSKIVVFGFYLSTRVMNVAEMTERLSSSTSNITKVDRISVVNERRKDREMLRPYIS